MNHYVSFTASLDTYPQEVPHQYTSQTKHIKSIIYYIFITLVYYISHPYKMCCHIKQAD